MVRLPPSAKSQTGAVAPRAPSTPAGTVTQTVAQSDVAGSTTIPSLPALPDVKPNAFAATTQLASRAAIERQVTALKAQLDEAAAAMPPEGQAPLKAALATSAERVLVSLDRGRISVDEAERGLRMLAEMTGALLALEHGRVRVTPASAYESTDLHGFDVETTSGDVLRVGVRPAGNEHGEARVKLETVKDDGAPVAQADRLMIRFDLEGSGETSASKGARAALDLQFGKERFSREAPREKLNKRIHGVLLDDAGRPVLNRGGNTVPDHHFRAGMPSTLDDAAGFSRFVRSFLDELELHRAPGAGSESGSESGTEPTS